MTLILTAADVAELLTWDACIAAVEDAFRAHGEGRLHAPGILSVHAEHGAFHTKTASVGRYFTAKTNANFPGNAPLPTIQGVVLLFDETNGVPLAVMDSIEITARRTAAASAVAAKHLARRDSHVIELYGCGRQGKAHLEAFARVMAIDHVIRHDVGLNDASNRTPDIIITTTTSRQAFLDKAPKGAFIAAVGADNPQKSEIAPDLMRSSKVITDVTEQAATIGDLHHAPGAKAFAELGEVVAGRKPGRTSDDEVIIFDSTGTGFQDAAAAAIVYERAKAQGRGTEIRFA